MKPCLVTLPSQMSVAFNIPHKATYKAADPSCQVRGAQGLASHRLLARSSMDVKACRNAAPSKPMQPCLNDTLAKRKSLRKHNESIPQPCMKSSKSVDLGLNRCQQLQERIKLLEEKVRIQKLQILQVIWLFCITIAGTCFITIIYRYKGFTPA
jgi:predicted metal-binding protein